MVLQVALQNENPNHDNDLDWSSKHERQLERLIFDRLHCFKLTILLKIIVKESYETSWTVDSIAGLAELSGFSISTVRRYLIQLEERRFIRRARMMSRHTKRDSVYMIVVNWCRIGYHPPRNYDISSLQKLQHINLIKPGDRFWINGIMQSHNKARAVYKSKPKKRSFFERFERTGGNIIKSCEINRQNSTEQTHKTKKIDEQKPTANADDYLKNLISNLALEFLSIVDELGFNAQWYIRDHFNRDAIFKAFCRELWRIHRNVGDETLIKTCFYAFQYKAALFHEFSTAKRLAANFERISTRQKQGIKLIAEITYPCRLKRYGDCYED